jgi:membrane-associated phospholipid phosphatase
LREKGSIARSEKRLSRAPKAGGAHLSAWASSPDSWLFRQIQALVDPKRSELRVLVLWAICVVAAASLFLGVLEDVVSGEPLVRLDAAVYRALQGVRTAAGDTIMIGITELGDTVVTTSLTLTVFVWLAWQRAWRTAVYWAAAVGFAALLNTTIKLIIHRPRPGDLGYVGASAFSFPSGHATVNAVIWGFLAFLIVRDLRPIWRLPIFTMAGVFAALIAFSRLYLGAHWFSDVTASLAFAAAWVIVLALAYVHHHEKPFNRRSLALVACVALAVAGGFNIVRSHAEDTRRYAVRDETLTIAASEWWTGGWRHLPAYRVDLTGEDEEPLTIQWAGSLSPLEGRLLQNGWRRPPPWSLSSALAWLATADPQKLPVIPSLEAGRMPGLTLIRTNGADANSRLVLQLWPTNLRLENRGTVPLWVGSIVEEHISRPLSFVTVVRTSLDVKHPLDILIASIADGRIAKRGSHAGKWDGRVLLGQEGLGSLPKSED